VLVMQDRRPWFPLAFGPWKFGRPADSGVEPDRGDDIQWLFQDPHGPPPSTNPKERTVRWLF